jgi:hypothetical protein
VKSSAAIIIGAILLVLTACAAQDEEGSTEKPKIIEVFACSDYCPGPRENYLQRAYDGVSDQETCRALGGQPYTYSGWGSTFICLAK